MDAIQRNPEAASRTVGAVQNTGSAGAARKAAAPTPEPVRDETTVTLSRQARDLAARKAQESEAAAVKENAQTQSQQMSLLNAQLRRAYVGVEGSGGAG